MKHDFFIKRRVLPLFDEGKILEIRIAISRFTVVRAGDTIVFGGTVTRTVKTIHPYPSFEVMGICENPEHIWPGATMEEVIKILKEIYPPELEKRGVLVFELSP